MGNRQSARQRAIRRRNLFLVCCVAVLAAVVALAAVLIVWMVKTVGGGNGDGSSKLPESQLSSEETSSGNSSSGPEYVQRGEYTLDANYTNLMLVNGENPLPEDYDWEGNLTEIEDKYINGSLKQIDQDIWPYMRAMIEAAWADGVQLYVWSPYRSYSVQNMLFQNQVQRCIDQGTPADQAEAEAATVVARPGTSEHHTGLAADFNMADDAFEETAMYAWMQQHAAEYGFILRYPKEKMDRTGVIYEPWHWRFVGINMAAEINASGLCLEEFLEARQ